MEFCKKNSPQGYTISNPSRVGKINVILHAIIASAAKRWGKRVSASPFCYACHRTKSQTCVKSTLRRKSLARVKNFPNVRKSWAKHYAPRLKVSSASYLTVEIFQKIFIPTLRKIFEIYNRLSSWYLTRTHPRYHPKGATKGRTLLPCGERKNTKALRKSNSGKEKSPVAYMPGFCRSIFDF